MKTLVEVSHFFPELWAAILMSKIVNTRAKPATFYSSEPPGSKSCTYIHTVSDLLSYTHNLLG